MSLKTLMSNATQKIACIGCRRSVEAFVIKLAESDQRAFSVRKHRWQSLECGLSVA